MNSTTVKFIKMQATGNDFIVIDGRQFPNQDDYSKLSKKIADRHFGVGADQVLFYLESKACDAQMVVFNNDGSRAEMSGNGMRCFAKYLYDQKIVQSKTMSIETLAGVIRPQILGTDSQGLAQDIQVNMGPKQSYQREKLKNNIFADWDKSLCAETHDLAPDELWIHRVSMGNPHAVLFVTNVDAVPLEVWGPVIENHDAFPNRTNFEVVQWIAPNQMMQRTWERGASETLACGTGACAVTQSVIETKNAGKDYVVTLRGGQIRVIQDESGNLLQSGEVHLICVGEFYV